MIMVITIIFMCLNTFLPFPFSPVKAEASRYPFKLIITLEKTTYKLGEPVNVTWCLINIGDKNETLWMDEPVDDFVIRDKNLKRVYIDSSARGVFLVHFPFLTLQPSRNVTITASWYQIYDGSDYVREDLRFKRVPQGIYYMSGAFRTYIETPLIKIIIMEE